MKSKQRQALKRLELSRRIMSKSSSSSTSKPVTLQKSFQSSTQQHEKSHRHHSRSRGHSRSHSNCSSSSGSSCGCCNNNCNNCPVYDSLGYPYEPIQCQTVCNVAPYVFPPVPYPYPLYNNLPGYPGIINPAPIMNPPPVVQVSPYPVGPFYPLSYPDGTLYNGCGSKGRGGCGPLNQYRGYGGIPRVWTPYETIRAAGNIY